MRVMRDGVLATLLAALTWSAVGLVWPAAGLATGVSINHESLPPGTTIGACLARANRAIAAVGLQTLNSTNAAAFGEREGGRLYAIYCMPQHNVVTFVGAGENSQDVSPDVTALMSAFRAMGGGGK